MRDGVLIGKNSALKKALRIFSEETLFNPYQLVSGCFLLLLNQYRQKKTQDGFE